MADNGNQHNIETNNRSRQNGFRRVAVILRSRLPQYLSGQSFLADFHPIMKKPYDLEADDPWLASGYNPSTLPDSKLQHPYKRGGEDDRMTAHQLTVLWTMLPEWVRICSRKTDKKMVAGWKEKAATAALKHAVFRDGDIPRQVSVNHHGESFECLM